MGLESASYISQLITSNPPESDPAETAADHLRLVKSVLQNSFPNVTGPVIATQSQLNTIGTGVVPPGAITLWYGTLASIPAGWGLCNGSIYSLLAGGTITSPNLNQFFVVGAGTGLAPGTTGGSFTSTDAGTVLTLANLPNYSLTVTDPGHVHTVNDPGHNHGTNYANAGGHGYAAGSSYTFPSTGDVTGWGYTNISLNAVATGITVASGGSGTAHTHTMGILPPYVALAYIMKL